MENQIREAKAPPPESKGLDLEAIERLLRKAGRFVGNLPLEGSLTIEIECARMADDLEVRRLRAGAEGPKAFISPDLFARLREAQKENEGWTFYLPDPLGPPGQPRSKDCNYCHRPKSEHRDDGRCPIRGCTLAGPPAGAEGGATGG